MQGGCHCAGRDAARWNADVLAPSDHRGRAVLGRDVDTTTAVLRQMRDAAPTLSSGP
jgi:hypothetical protein